MLTTTKYLFQWHRSSVNKHSSPVESSPEEQSWDILKGTQHSKFVYYNTQRIILVGKEHFIRHFNSVSFLYDSDVCAISASRQLKTRKRDNYIIP